MQKNVSSDIIVHEYLASSSQENDIVHSVKAAQAVFSEFFKQFVVMGHSQDDDAAWAAAQREVINSISGYLGIIAVSFYTGFLNENGNFGPFMKAIICQGIVSVRSKFDSKDILTSEEEQRLAIMYQTDADVVNAIVFLYGAEVVKSDWKQNPHLQEYGSSTSNENQQIKKPVLIIHEEFDNMNTAPTVSDAVERTADLFPSSQLELVLLPHVTHAPALGASQRLWMDWIGDRFAKYLEQASQFYHTFWYICAFFDALS